MCEFWTRVSSSDFVFFFFFFFFFFILIHDFVVMGMCNIRLVLRTMCVRDNVIYIWKLLQILYWCFGLELLTEWCSLSLKFQCISVFYFFKVICQSCYLNWHVSKMKSDNPFISDSVSKRYNFWYCKSVRYWHLFLGQSSDESEFSNCQDMIFFFFLHPSLHFESWKS